MKHGSLFSGIGGIDLGFEMWRIICELRPRWVLIENVANLVNKGGSRVLHDLAKAGYDAEWQVISARDVGARHLRKRLWIVAYKREISNSNSDRCKDAPESIKKSSKGSSRKEHLQGNQTSKSFRNVSKTNRRRKKRISKGEDQSIGKFKIQTFEILKNEPRLDRVAYGLSQKLDRYNDRVKGLGNAVVPQIPYQLGKRIMQLNKMINE